MAIFGAFKAWGGIESTVAVLANAFVGHGVIPTFVLLRGGATPYPERLPAEARAVDLRTRGKWHAVPRIIQYLRSERPAAVITVDAHSAEAVMLASLLGRLNVPVFVKATNTLSEAVRRPGRRRLIKWLYPRASGVIAVSGGVAEDLVSNFGVPRGLVHVIYNPMSTVDIPGRAARDVEHPWFQGDQGKKVVLGVGRLCRQKGFDDLIRAFAILRSRRSCRLVLLGEGDERGALEALADEQGVSGDLSLPGYVSDPIPYMARCGVFALSSRYEGLGNVVIEALAAGARVVSTDCPSGPKEILEGGRHGELVAVGDLAAMANALERALDGGAKEFDRQTMERFGSAAASRYLQVMGLI
ncbi:hypothetical protein ECTOBSL9_0471 [Ectothiorhodospira sp. BSL-9]|nr:hypothetical protein ECTOBSL9_0471 [Ectothiorhodospira sp. BSL-9]